jgi:hypothetical protein
MKTQKQIVFELVSTMFSPSDSGAYILSKEDRHAVAAKVIAAINEGDVEVKSTKVKPETYVPGMVSNWLRKDSRLNGDVKYTPGFRKGPNGDPQLKAMRALKAITTDPDKLAVIEQHIARKELELARPAAASVDFDSLPEELKALFNKS